MKIAGRRRTYRTSEHRWDKNNNNKFSRNMCAIKNWKGRYVSHALCCRLVVSSFKFWIAINSEECTRAEKGCFITLLHNNFLIKRLALAGLFALQQLPLFGDGAAVAFLNICLSRLVIKANWRPAQRIVINYRNQVAYAFRKNNLLRAAQTQQFLESGVSSKFGRKTLSCFLLC